MCTSDDDYSFDPEAPEWVNDLGTVTPETESLEQLIIDSNTIDDDDEPESY